MPIEKFDDFDSARRALWLESGDPRILERFQELMKLSDALAPPVKRFRGVRKYRSVEEADADRQAMREERITDEPLLSLEDDPREALHALVDKLPENLVPIVGDFLEFILSRSDAGERAHLDELEER